MSLMKNISKAEVLALKDQVSYQEGQVVSKTLAQNDAVSVTLFAFDKDEEISTHESGGDAFVTCLDGVGRITIDGEEYQLHEGESIVMPAETSPRSIRTGAIQDAAGGDILISAQGYIQNHKYCKTGSRVRLSSDPGSRFYSCPVYVICCFRLIYIHLRESLSECAHDLVVDGTCCVGDIISCDLVYTVLAHYRHFVSETDIRYVGNVDHALVHADVSCDRCEHAVHNDFALH